MLTVSTVRASSAAACSPLRAARIVKWGAAFAAAAIALAAATAAADDDNIVRVEEDWRIEVGTPDPSENTPQITIAVLPTGSFDAAHAVFEMNHRTLPSYGAGGTQLQVWTCENCNDYRNFPNSALLTTPNEVITFTVKVEVTGGKLKFEVVNGQSSTWGTFGGQGYLKAQIDTILTNLNTFDSQASTKHSKVGYASHRVKKLVRTEVRKYSAQSLDSKDTTDVVVHEHSGS